MNTIANIKQNSSDKIVVSLVASNFLTRWPCHVCGGHTDKVSILAEVTDGPYAGFRVCETCLKTRDFDKKLIEHAKRLEEQSAELRKLVGCLEVPTLAEWYQRDIEHEIETIRSHDHYTDIQIVEYFLDDLSGIDNLTKEYAHYRIEWLMQNGLTRKQIDERIASNRVASAKERLAAEIDFDCPF